MKFPRQAWLWRSLRNFSCMTCSSNTSWMAALCLLALHPQPKAQAPSLALPTETVSLLALSESVQTVPSRSKSASFSPMTRSSASIRIASGCDGDRQITAQVYSDSVVVDETGTDRDGSQVIRLSDSRKRTADSLFTLLEGLGGAMILRCPNVESVTCRFEASLKSNRLECTNCSACSDDLDRMSLATLRRFKSLLRELNLFL